MGVVFALHLAALGKCMGLVVGFVGRRRAGKHFAFRKAIAHTPGVLDPPLGIVPGRAQNTPMQQCATRLFIDLR